MADIDENVDTTGAVPDDTTAAAAAGAPNPDEGGSAGTAPEAGQSTEEGAAAAAGSEEGDKAGEGANASPETYADFTLPEGFDVDQDVLDMATPVFKDLNLSQENAQKVVDLFAAVTAESEKRQLEGFAQLIGSWQEDAFKDPEIGGEKFEENAGIAMLAMDKFGTPELKELMNDHGVGNHPEMIRFMWKVGKLLKEDVPDNGGSAPAEQKDAVSILYPNDRNS